MIKRAKTIRTDCTIFVLTFLVILGFCAIVDLLHAKPAKVLVIDPPIKRTEFEKQVADCPFHELGRLSEAIKCMDNKT